MKRSTSSLRAAVSRANGAKSRGPVTDIGKYNSSRNPIRRGLLSRFLVLPGEMSELFQEQYDDFMEDHQPRTPTERTGRHSDGRFARSCRNIGALVEEMVTAWWRKQRVRSMESTRITHQVKLSASMGHAVPVSDPATRTAPAVVRSRGCEGGLPTPETIKISKRTREPLENVTPSPLRYPANPSRGLLFRCGSLRLPPPDLSGRSWAQGNLKTSKRTQEAAENKASLFSGTPLTRAIMSGASATGTHGIQSVVDRS